MFLISLNKSTIRCYTVSIALSLLFRATSEVIDFFTQDKLDKVEKAFSMTVDLMIVISYFTELIPFLLINIVLWKSFTESKRINLSQSLLLSKKTYRIDGLDLTDCSVADNKYENTVDTTPHPFDSYDAYDRSKMVDSGNFGTIAEVTEEFQELDISYVRETLTYY